MALKTRKVRVDISLELQEYKQLTAMAKADGRSIRGMATLFVRNQMAEIMGAPVAVQMIRSDDPGIPFTKNTVAIKKEENS